MPKIKVRTKNDIITLYADDQIVVEYKASQPDRVGREAQRLYRAIFNHLANGGTIGNYQC